MNNTTTGKIVSFTLNPNSPLSPDDLAQLNALKNRNIDFSDIPASTADAEWTHPGALIPETKKQVTLRIDADVLNYFRRSGKRYQTRINGVLRAYMHAHQSK